MILPYNTMEVSWKMMLAVGVVIILLVYLCYMQREIIALKQDKINKPGTFVAQAPDAAKDSKWAI